MVIEVKALFKINCGLFLTAVEWQGKRNGCITNTLMQQSHAPIKLSLTVQKEHLTHDMITSKGSVAISVASAAITSETIRRFGFVSGREADKFAGVDFHEDCNGNPYLMGEEFSAVFALRVYDTVDMGTHTMFLCQPDEMIDLEQSAITYTQYQQALRNKANR